MIHGFADPAISAIEIVVQQAISDRDPTRVPNRLIVIIVEPDSFLIEVKQLPVVDFVPPMLVPVRISELNAIPRAIERLIWPSDVSNEIVLFDEPSLDPPQYPLQKWRDIVLLQDVRRLERSNIAQSYNCT